MAKWVAVVLCHYLLGVQWFSGFLFWVSGFSEPVVFNFLKVCVGR